METKTVEARMNMNTSHKEWDANNDAIPVVGRDMAITVKQLWHSVKNFIRFWCSFSGRLRRRQFLWQFPLVFSLMTLTIAGIAMSASSIQNSILRTLVILCGFVPMMVLLVASAGSLIIRRLHDLNYSRKWFWSYCITMIGIVRMGELLKDNTSSSASTAFITFPTFCAILIFSSLLSLFLLRGTQGANSFGVNPRDEMKLQKEKNQEEKIFKVTGQRERNLQDRDANTHCMGTADKQTPSAVQLLRNVLKNSAGFWCAFSGRLSRGLFFWQFTPVYFLLMRETVYILAPETWSFLHNPILLNIVASCDLWPITLFLYISAASLATRRLYDINCSRIWLWLYSIMCVGCDRMIEYLEKNSSASLYSEYPIERKLAIAFFIITFACLMFLYTKRGTRGANKYGTDPRETANRPCNAC